MRSGESGATNVQSTANNINSCTVTSFCVRRCRCLVKVATQQSLQLGARYATSI